MQGAKRARYVSNEERNNSTLDVARLAEEHLEKTHPID